MFASLQNGGTKITFCIHLQKKKGAFCIAKKNYLWIVEINIYSVRIPVSNFTQIHLIKKFINDP